MEEVTRLTSRLQHKTHGQLELVVRIYMESQSKVDAMEVALITVPGITVCNNLGVFKT